MTKLIDFSIRDYQSLLASQEAVPGGGSAAALSGAQGASLLAMIAHLTTGSEKYADIEPFYKDIIRRAEDFASRFMSNVDADSQSYQEVMRAFQLPKYTDEDKNARKQAIAAALKRATEVPFDTLSLALETLRLCEEAQVHANPNAASDLGTAAATLQAAARSAWLNVKINTKGKTDEESLAFTERGERMLAESDRIAEKIFYSIDHSLR